MAGGYPGNYSRAIAAGLVTGLMFYKPQLGAVLASVVVISLGWRSMIGLAITGTLLLLASLALPGSLHDFLFQMPRNLHFVQCDVPYMWDRHVTFKAFWRMLMQGMGAGETKWIVTGLSSLRLTLHFFDTSDGGLFLLHDSCFAFGEQVIDFGLKGIAFLFEFD